MDSRKSQKISIEVIPAEAGIHANLSVIKILAPGFHRGDDFWRDHLLI